MIALNLILMITVVVGIVSLLSWTIVSDRRTKRAAGVEFPRSQSARPPARGDLV
jgi:hypothetical protein